MTASAGASWTRQLTTILSKDLLAEWRTRARLNAVLFFAMLTLLLFSFAVGPQHNLLVRIAPGFLWLAILLSSTLALQESIRTETENWALEGLRLLPVAAEALFLGKALANGLFLFCLGLLLIPIALVLYGADIRLSIPCMLLVLALGVGAISAPGTLYAVITAQARGRDVLLPLLLFPILVPGLLCAVKATTLVMQGDAMGELSGWLGLLGAFNLVYWPLCTVLFGRVIEP